MAPEARLAWDGLRVGRRVDEEARPGSRFWYRVGKNEMVVKRRGVAGGLSRGSRAFPGGGVASGERPGEGPTGAVGAAFGAAYPVV